jgi:hypothetical protein
VTRRLLIAAGCLAIVRAASAQEIAIYSEFQRFDPTGQVVPQDFEPNQREVLSPALARNGHLSVHVVVTAPRGTNYFLYAGVNPENTVRVQVYREHFVSCGQTLCPDWLTPVQTPVFGAIPESTDDVPGQTTRCYLFDIWAPPDSIPRRVRVEALLKTGIWNVGPMEIRIVAPLIPAATLQSEQNIAPLEAPASATAQLQLLRYLAGLEPVLPNGILRVRDIIQRNAAEDMLLAKSYGRYFPELTLFGWLPFAMPDSGAEWYLRVRDFLLRYTT